MAPFEGFRNPSLALKLTTNAEARNELLKEESEAFTMTAAHVQDDIEDAIMFYHKLAEYVGEESELKNRANLAIERGGWRGSGEDDQGGYRCRKAARGTE